MTHALHACAVRGAVALPGGARAVAAVAACLLAAGCRPTEPIKVGFVAGLTGRHYNLGVSERNGLQLAVAEINAAGGIRGRPIEILVRDDEQDPEAARRAVEGLVQAGVVAIVGHATSAMAEATLPIADRAGVLMLSPTVTSSAFLGKDDQLVTLNPSTAGGAQVLADHLARRGSAHRVTVFYDLSNRSYSQSWHDEFQKALEARGGRIVRAVPFTSGSVPSFAELVEGALREPTDAVMVVANSLDSATLCQKIRAVSARMPILGAEWGFTNDLVAHGGPAIEGALFVQKVNVDDESPPFARFRQAYDERYHRPVDFAATLAYEAGMVLAEALRRDPTRAGVKRALLDIGTFRGLQGPIQFDRFGDVTRRHFLMTVRAGRAAAVE
jgi:branched-chain amino acid transport system substrate-binding protein